LFASLLAASVVLALGLLALGGCTGSGNPAGTSPDVSGASSPSPQPRTIDGCVGESDGAMFDYERSGTVTPAILLGTAGPGVVISYEANGDVCTWLPLANRLVAAGYRALLYERNNLQAPEDDIVAMARNLHDRGIESVFLVGGSMGGRLSPLAATRLDFRIAGVVNLAGVVLPEHAAGLTAPFLQVYGTEDPLAPAAGMLAAHEAAGQARSRTLLPVAGSAHASRLFRTDQGSQVLDAIMSFRDANRL
jgi:pimeloyl-ACP methyl ester carboxylesterase